MNQSPPIGLRRHAAAGAVAARPAAALSESELTTPFLLYLLFISSWFLHLPARYPVLGIIRMDLLLVAILSGLALMQPKVATEKRSVSTLLRYLLGYAVLVLPFTYWPGSVVTAGLPGFFKAFVFFAFTVAYVKTPRQLRLFLYVFVGCQAFRVLEPLYLHLTTGYWGDAATMEGFERLDRLSGAPLDVVNPNGLAFIDVTALTFMSYLTAGSKKGRLLYLALLPPMLYALALTGSRTGFLALCGVMGLIWYNSRYKVVIALGFVVVAAIAIPNMSADLADRYLSIFSSKTKNAATTELRWVGLGNDIIVAMKRPIFGFGLGTSREANANFGTHDQPSHNLYVEVLQELGLVGLTLYVCLLVAMVRESLRAAKVVQQKANPPPILLSLVRVLQVWLAMNLLFSFASYGLSSFEWYLMAGLSEVVFRIAEPLANAEAPAGSPLGRLRTAIAPAHPSRVPVAGDRRGTPVQAPVRFRPRHSS